MYIYRERIENRSYIIDTENLREYSIKTKNPEKILKRKFDEAEFINSSTDRTVRSTGYGSLVPFEKICSADVFDMRSVMIRGRLIHFLVILNKYFYIADFEECRNQEGFKITCCAVYEDHISLYLTRWKGYMEEIVLSLINDKSKKQLAEKICRLKNRDEMYRVNKMLLAGSFKGVESITG